MLKEGERRTEQHSNRKTQWSMLMGNGPDARLLRNGILWGVRNWCRAGSWEIKGNPKSNGQKRKQVPVAE